MGALVVDRAMSVHVRLRQMKVNRGRIGASSDEEVVAGSGHFVEGGTRPFGEGPRRSRVVLELDGVGLGVGQLEEWLLLSVLGTAWLSGHEMLAATVSQRPWLIWSDRCKLGAASSRELLGRLVPKRLLAEACSSTKRCQLSARRLRHWVSHPCSQHRALRHRDWMS